MASKYWIKLYHEILDDPKMGRLTDRLWRRTIELFLIAGDNNGKSKSGILPGIHDIAWRLRLKEEELETDLADLASFGIVNKSDDRWVVTNFEKRQQPMPKDEYMRRLRSTRKSDVFVTEELPASYQSVTKSNAEEETDKETDIDKNKKLSAGKIFEVYEHEIGPLTAHSSDIVGEWIDNYSEVFIIDAIHEAVKYNARSPNYVSSILERWKRDGRGDKKKPGVRVDPVKAELHRLMEEEENGS